ncbi:MAG: phage terminase small subunit P27 family [Alkalilacustris sp.]
MSKGRKRIPEHLKVVRGTDRPDRRNDAAPAPVSARPPMPSTLTETAQANWDRFCGVLEAMGVLTVADEFALEQLVEAYADWRQSHEIIAAEGTHYESESVKGGLMVRAHPAVGMRSDAARRFQSLLSEFGLTPASRSRVSAAEKGDQVDDPAAKYGF